MNEEATRFLLKYFSAPKTARSTYLRENNSMKELAKKIMDKYGLSKPQQAYELALLSIGLGVPAEEIAPLLRAYKKHSKESLFRVVEQLINMTFGEEDWTEILTSRSPRVAEKS